MSEQRHSACSKRMLNVAVAARARLNGWQIAAAYLTPESDSRLGNRQLEVYTQHAMCRTLRAAHASWELRAYAIV